jgi:hypothetical protein
MPIGFSVLNGALRASPLTLSVLSTPPCLQSRRSILQLCRGQDVQWVVGDADLDRVAQQTEGFTPADLRALCEQAGELPVACVGLLASSASLAVLPDPMLWPVSTSLPVYIAVSLLCRSSGR